MTRQSQIWPEFVTFAPGVLEPGVLYVSMECATVLHGCCCGCGNKVVTTLAPDRWSLLYDGRAISLEPSIGNWSFPCQSHYWIEGNTVIWDRQFTRSEIDRVRSTGQPSVRRSDRKPGQRPEVTTLAPPPLEHRATNPWWKRVLARFRDSLPR